MSSLTKIQAVLMISYLILYAGANIILKNQDSLILTVAKALLLFAFFIVSSGAPARSYLSSIKPVFVCLILLMLFQVVFLLNIKAVKIIGFNLLALVFFARWSNLQLLNLWLWGIKITAVLLSISAAYLAYLFGDFVYCREDVFLDKGYVTAFYCTTFISCIADINFNRHRIINLIILVFVFLIDLLIVQSKLSLFILGISFLFVLYIRKKLHVRQLFMYSAMGIMSFFIVNAILPEDSPALDPIKQGINQLTGSEILETQRANMKTDTYDIRNELWRYCIEDIFPEHPIIGIGLGNFGEYAKKGKTLIRGLEETESSLLSVITEGGIFYLITMISFFSILIRTAYLKMKMNTCYEYLLIFLFFSGFAIMTIGNDFLDSLFWIQAGLMIGVLYNKELCISQVN